MGGVGLAMRNRSSLIEVAKLESHASSAVKNQDRFNPSNISLVFGRHRRLDQPDHGIEVAKMEKGGEAKYKRYIQRKNQRKGQNK